MSDYDESTQTNSSPKFALLQYAVLHSLDISITEYFYLDMVYYLSRDSWCYKSLESIATDMKMTKQGVVRLRDRLIHKGLVIKDAKGRVRSSVTYNKVYLQAQTGTTKFNDRTTKFNAGVQQSGTKNNNRNTEENKGFKKSFNKYGQETLESAQARIGLQA